MKRFSIIICTYNRNSILAKSLKSVLNQDFNTKKLVEILVIDNNSSDSTRDVIKRFEKKSKIIRYYFEKNQGLANARNKGLKEARGKYLIYIDDDVVLPKKYLTNVDQTIKKYDPDILGGPVYPKYISAKPAWFQDRLQIRKYENKSCFSITCRISGGNFIIKRNLLLRLGKFDPALGMKGEQIGLGEEAKILDKYRFLTLSVYQKVYYSLDCFVKHLVTKEKMTIRYVTRRFYEGGRLSIKMKLMHKRLSFRLIYDTLGYNIFKLIRRFVQSLLDLFFHGYKKVDYISILNDLFFSIGILVGILNYLIVSKNKA